MFTAVFGGSPLFRVRPNNQRQLNSLENVGGETKRPYRNKKGHAICTALFVAEIAEGSSYFTFVKVVASLVLLFSTVSETTAFESTTALTL
jgi:hypothetical protein